MTAPNLSVASATVPDINDKLNVIAGRIQNLDAQGTLDASDISSGLLALARGGTNADLSATGGASKFLKQASAGAAITVVQPAFADLSDFTAITNVAFAAGNFTSSAGTWVLTSGDQINYQYMKIGAALLVIFDFHTTTITGGPTELYFPVPTGFTATKRADTRLGLCIEGGTSTQDGSVKTTAGSATLTIYKPSGAAWTNGTDNCYFAGQIWVT